QPMPSSDLAHCREELDGQTTPAARARALRGERAERVRRLTRPQFREDVLDRGIDSIRQRLVRAIPPERSRVALRDHLVVGLVVDDELEVAQRVFEEFPPRVEHVAMAVVFGPYRLGRNTALPEIGTIRSRVHFE